VCFFRGKVVVGKRGEVTRCCEALGIGRKVSELSSLPQAPLLSCTPKAQFYFSQATDTSEYTSNRRWDVTGIQLRASAITWGSARAQVNYLEQQASITRSPISAYKISSSCSVSTTTFPLQTLSMLQTCTSFTHMGSTIMLWPHCDSQVGLVLANF
jgi:hypothetical protein